MSEKATFTPGPWSADPCNDRDGKVVIYYPEPDGRILAQTWPDRLQSDFKAACAVAEANARLIAKAPELYARLVACITALEDCEAGECEEARAAREVIAEVDGNA